MKHVSSQGNLDLLRVRLERIEALAFMLEKASDPGDTEGDAYTWNTANMIRELAEGARELRDLLEAEALKREAA